MYTVQHVVQHIVRHVVQQQNNSNDCGVYALAFSTSLLFCKCLTKFNYYSIRKHFIDCIVHKKVVDYPIIVSCRKNSILRIVNDDLFVMCRDIKLEYYSHITACDNCNEWFHDNRILLYISKLFRHCVIILNKIYIPIYRYYYWPDTYIDYYWPNT